MEGDDSAHCSCSGSFYTSGVPKDNIPLLRDFIAYGKRVPEN